jgi:tripartite ATP-independent transporter DctP family solute receptor
VSAVSIGMGLTAPLHGSGGGPEGHRREAHMRRLGWFACVVALVMVVSLSMAHAGEQNAVVLKLGHGSQLKSPLQSTSEEFAKRIAEQTKGRIRVDVYGNMQLGQERDMVEGLQLGTVDMTIVSTGPLSGFAPGVTVVDLPFLFNSEQHAYKVLDGEIGQGLLKQLEPKGIVGLAFLENGFRQITSSKRIATPADLKGVKLRTMENKVHMASFKEMGAAPVPMVWGEVYTSLSQKVIDGQENPIHIIYANALWEVQKYVIMTGHFYTPYIFAMSKKSLDKVPADLRPVLLATAKEMAPFERNLVKTQQGEQIATLKAKGMEIIEVNRALFQTASQPVYKQFEQQFGKELIDRIIAAGK